MAQAIIVIGYVEHLDDGFTIYAENHNDLAASPPDFTIYREDFSEIGKFSGRDCEENFVANIEKEFEKVYWLIPESTPDWKKVLVEVINSVFVIEE